MRFLLLSHGFKWNNGQREGVNMNSLLAFLVFFVSFFTPCCVVVLVVVCISFFLPGSLATFGLGRFGLLVSKLVHRHSLSVLTDPGLPLPMDAAPPTTVQCIRSAAPRDCPRTSLSLFPHSSSLVRRGREGSRYRRKSGSLTY